MDLKIFTNDDEQQLNLDDEEDFDEYSESVSPVSRGKMILDVIIENEV